MARILAMLFVSAAVALPAFGAETIDPATVTCTQYNAGTHQGMMDIISAMYDAVKKDPKVKAPSEEALMETLDKVCAAHPDAKVIDALHS